MKKLSIIVPVYNVEQYLEKCLNSIVKQENVCHSDYEVIVVNDGSPDKSLEIALKFENKYENLKVVSQENGGLSAARNTGISLAQGEYVWCIDSDDWIEPHSLSIIFEKIVKEKVDFLTIAGVFSDTGKVRNLLLTTNNPRELFVTQKWNHNAQFYIYKKKFLIDNGLFFKRGIYHEDSEFTPRMMFMAKTCIVTNAILYTTFINPSSITRRLNAKRSYDYISVAESLSIFSDEHYINKREKYVFYTQIAIFINNALSNINQHPKSEKQHFNQYIHEYKNILIPALLHSNVLKYQIEGLLFFMFGKRYIEIYRLLNFFMKK